MPKARDCRLEKRETNSVEWALALLEGRWKCLILFQLLAGTARFSELRRCLPFVTQRTLTKQLRELEHDGLLYRRVYAQVPSRVDYTISPLGLTLEPVLRALQGWGELHRAQLTSLKTSKRRRLDERQLPKKNRQLPTVPECVEATNNK